MAEYWKSTPKYWCKFCATYVRDTALERRNHESTGRHQSAIQRNLRNLHKDTDRQEREKQRAKDEVARLNGVVSGNSASSSSTSAGGYGRGSAGKTAQKHATVEERKKQLAQLAAMGVAVPEDYRREVAMAGEWETVSVKPVTQTPPPSSSIDSKTGIKKENDESKESVKAEAKAFGVRKRKLDAGEDEDEAALEASKKQPWGSRFKKFPSGAGGEEDDIEALLGSGKDTKIGEAAASETETAGREKQPGEGDEAVVKKETEEPILATLPESGGGDAGEVVAEEKKEEVPGAGIVFKKRRKAVAPK